MKFKYKIFLIMILLILANNLKSQTKNIAIKNALSIADKNKNQLENVKQLLVVYNEKPQSFRAVFAALEKKGKNWAVKQSPIEALIG